jgi:sugar/nucleoside kinase (ribokinase family)
LLQGWICRDVNDSKRFRFCDKINRASFEEAQSLSENENPQTKTGHETAPVRKTTTAKLTRKVIRMESVSEKRTVSFCVVGNVMLDAITSLHHVKLAEADRFPTLRNPIRLIAGGTGVIAALGASKQGFYPVSIIGKIGTRSDDGQPDTAARFIIDSLTDENIHMCFSKDNQRPTGTTMITYFSEDARLLVADRGANDSFTMEDLSPEFLATVARSDILLVSGFMLVEPTQARAMMRLMEEARSHHRLVILDVVPHSIYKSVDGSTFREYTRFVNVLISEIATVRRLFSSLEVYDLQTQVDEIAADLLKNYDAVILRPSNLYQYVYDKRGFVFGGPTGYNENDREGQRGYLDLSAIQLIQEHYQRLKSYS